MDLWSLIFLSFHGKNFDNIWLPKDDIESMDEDLQFYQLDFLRVFVLNQLQEEEQLLI